LKQIIRALSFCLFLATAAPAASVFVSNATPFCGFQASQNAPALASASIGTNQCFASPVSVTASESGWTAAVSISGGFGDIGSATAIASFSPSATILGGSGSGFLRVQSTSVIDSGNLWCCMVSLTAGDLALGGRLNSLHIPYAASAQNWSGFIPFTFGVPLPLPGLYASLSYEVSQSTGLHGFAVDSITAFDIRDANLQTVDGAFVIAAPEPASIAMGLLGAAALWRRARKMKTQGWLLPQPKLHNAAGGSGSPPRLWSSVAR
jgi:hypothetical protein